jgi:outer membrane protein OmpA-like peptidoglycan-associated protein/tetratricopeptide (TPR) repeat protein
MIIKTNKKKYNTLIINKKRIDFLCLFLCIFSSFTFAQQNKRSEKLFEEAKNYYSSNKNEEAINICNQILKKDTGFFHADLLLSEIYKDRDSTTLEIKHLKHAQYNSKNALINFRLGESYYKLENYSTALKYYTKYSQANLTEDRKKKTDKRIKSCTFAIKSINHPCKFNPEPLNKNINTNSDEYWPTPTLDGAHLIFTRLLNNNSQFQEDFYIADINSDSQKVIPITDINTPENEGAQTISADSRLLFFTACNRTDGFGSCDIYFSRMINGKWTTPCNAGEPLNTSSWEGQPSLSSDKHWLYFSSNRSGGKGRKDIWRIRLKGFSKEGMPQWEKPENMGTINTEGDELSPFIHANNHNLYFASDGQIGMGGFDLFSSSITSSGKIDTFKNIGYPINTINDEIGLTINAAGNTAYFASTRNSETGMDIFSFELSNDMRPTPVTYIQAFVSNKETHTPLQANIELINLKDTTESTDSEKADKNGQILLALPLGSNYAFNVSENGYLFYSQSILLADKKSITNPLIVNIQLEPVKTGAETNLYNIYFETDSFTLLPESHPELNKLVSFLKKNSNLIIEVQGHTDSSGNLNKNMELSKRRAQSVVNYLTAHQISINRLKAKGYGATKPVATNSTPEGRQQNRRTTIKITDFLNTTTK